MSAPSAKDFFTSEQREDIRQAIMDAELDTSGEIRVHIETSFQGDVMDRAAWIFKDLRMYETEQRNGVLIYLSVRNRRFAIIGDTGIHQKVGDAFWNDTKQAMIGHFRESRFTEGLTEAIRRAGLQLKKHFPYHKDDVNELSDDLSFGN